MNLENTMDLINVIKDYNKRLTKNKFEPFFPLTFMYIKNDFEPLKPYKISKDKFDQIFMGSEYKIINNYDENNDNLTILKHNLDTPIIFFTWKFQEIINKVDKNKITNIHIISFAKIYNHILELAKSEHLFSNHLIYNLELKKIL